MFRLISLSFDDPILGQIPKGSMVFVPSNERKGSEYPYTTVLIGPNGSGKSTILYYLVEIFNDLRHYKLELSRRKSKINFPYIIEYQIDEVVYSICQTKDLSDFDNSKQNMAWKYEIDAKKKGQKFSKIKIASLELPGNLVAISYLVQSRFTPKKNESKDFYQYLGLSSRTGNISARRILNNAIPRLFEFATQPKNVLLLRKILDFINVDSSYLCITAKYRYKEHFFTGDLNVHKLNYLFNSWKTFSKRKDEPYSISYYESTIKRNAALKNELVYFINYRSQLDKTKPGEGSRLKINLLEDQISNEQIQLLVHLYRLDLIEFFTLEFRHSKDLKANDTELSSGEFHYFSTMIAVAGCIQDNSMVVIDEPETSFHPNWQMKYINTLKEIFKSRNSAHFIISTHSHFMVSDLRSPSSEVIALSGHAPKISAEPIVRSTFGWSAEEALYKVFKVRTTRNHYFEYEITQLVNLINHSSKDYGTIRILLEKLNTLSLGAEDPLNIILEKANNYLQDNA